MTWGNLDANPTKVNETRRVGRARVTRSFDDGRADTTGVFQCLCSGGLCCKSSRSSSRVRRTPENEESENSVCRVVVGEPKMDRSSFGHKDWMLTDSVSIVFFA